MLSHAKRKRFNREINDLKRPEDAIYLELSGTRCKDDCEPQAQWCWPGQVVVGQQKPCEKSCIYEVVSCDVANVVLRAETNVRANGEKPEGATVVVPRKIATDAFRMCHSVTYCKSQGLTLRGLIVLADVNSEHFEIEHLNLGVTRATHSSLVELRSC